MLLSKGVLFAKPAHIIHEQCFSHGWREQEFYELLKLPTSRLWLNEDGLLLCSQVGDEMEILTIGVLPKKRRQGVATEFLRNLIDYAKESTIKKIFLEVAEDNKNAIHLYDKMGFKSFGIRKGYYDHGKVDAITYCLEL